VRGGPQRDDQALAVGFGAAPASGGEEPRRFVSGSDQKPSQDTKIGTDIAQPNGPDSQWSINTNKSGKFYAKAPKKPGCAAGFSDTVHSQ
jgi:hypothetical protein